jgi:hypothetical protein
MHRTVLAVTLVLAIILAGCGSPEKTSTASKPPATTAHTITSTPTTPTLNPTLRAIAATTTVLGPCSCTGDIYNCGDFASQTSAQACYDYCKSLGEGDIHKLDRDNDGRACE